MQPLATTGDETISFDDEPSQHSTYADPLKIHEPGEAPAHAAGTETPQSGAPLHATLHRSSQSAHPAQLPFESVKLRDNSAPGGKTTAPCVTLR